jgi:hypothetical protein
MSQENVLRGVRYLVSLPSERAGQRRTLDEHLFVRFTALYRLFAERVLRLPLRSRLRRLMLTRFAGRAYAARNRRDFEVMLLGLDPGIEYHPRDDLMPLDLDSVFTAEMTTGRSGEQWSRLSTTFGLNPRRFSTWGTRFSARLW